MKVNWSEPGMVVSGVAHAALLLLALVAFSDTQPFEDAQEAVAVDMISASEFSQITKGEKSAKEAKPDARPRADKVAETAELKPPAPDLKRDVPTPPARPPEPEAAAVPPAPPERPKDEQAEADAKARAEADARAKADAEAKARADAARAAAAAAAKAAAEAKAQADAKAEAEAREAEALRKAQDAKAEAEAKARQEAKAKAEAEARAKADAERKLAQEKAAEKARQEADARKAEEKKAEEAKKLAALAAETPKPKPAPAKPEAKFDPSQIEKLLTSKEQPQSAPSAGREINRTASLGNPNANGPKLSPSMKSGLQDLIGSKVRECWSPPPGVAKDWPKPRVEMILNPDGSLASEPRLLNSSTDPRFGPVAESTLRAIKRCAPFTIPAQYAAYYADWQRSTFLFDPSDMLD